MVNSIREQSTREKKSHPEARSVYGRLEHFINNKRPKIASSAKNNLSVEKSLTVAIVL